MINFMPIWIEDYKNLTLVIEPIGYFWRTYVEATKPNVTLPVEVQLERCGMAIIRDNDAEGQDRART